MDTIVPREGDVMPTINVDYMQVGHAKTFRVPMFAYRRPELTPGTKVLLLGDGVEDQIGVVDWWSDDHRIQITLVSA
jgi:hypothetical protein